MTIFHLSRREAIKLFGLSAGALALGAASKSSAATATRLNHFVSINPDNTVSIICHRSEMGQQIRTAIPMIVADELDVAWKDVRVVQADGDPKYGDQNTDGSVSIQNNWMTARELGATARALLVSAAAKEFKCNEADCRTENGFVWTMGSNNKLSYASLAKVASSILVPPKVTLKDPAYFSLIGKMSTTSVDAKAILSGRATYSIDVALDNMLIAVLERSPAIGGRVKSFDAAPALGIRGVKKVIELASQPQSINTQASVAVLATNTYAAMQGRRAITVEWDLSQAQKTSDKERRLELEMALSNRATPYRDDKDVDGAQGELYSSDYYCPYLAHAPMEPPCSTAHVAKSKCEIWAPTQDPQRLRSTIAEYLRIPEMAVTVHVTLTGGAFGRKAQTDFAMEAVMLSQKVGKPVKVVWSREDDIRHGFYHTDSLQRLTAKLNADGFPNSWEHKTAFATCGSVFDAKALKASDWELNFGATNMPYDIPNVRVSHCPVTSPVRIGWLRSVQNVFHGFAVNVFIDELAERAAVDPIVYRLQLLQGQRLLESDNVEKAAALKQDTSRMSALIRSAAQAAQWSRSTPGISKGFASHYSFCTYTAAVAWVSVSEKQIQVKRVDLSVDCGRMINPINVESQMQGAVVFGISAALSGNISLENGRIKQSNFHDYPVLRMNECPEINVYLMQSAAPPSGVGEPGVPCIAPAIANAVFRATGKRLRELPLTL